MSSDDFCKVYGHGDDLVEVEGGGLEDEFVYFEPGMVLEFSDGTVLAVTYGKDAVWEIEPLVMGASFAGRTIAPPSTDAYSDIVTLRGPLEWVSAR